MPNRSAPNDRHENLTRLALSVARSQELSPKPSDEAWGRIEEVVRRVVGLRDELVYEKYYVVARDQVSE